MHRLSKSVLGYIRANDLICAGDRVGVAVSGGADSVALLRLMLELRDELGFVLSVVHLNHKLRGAESDADEQFVHELAQAHELEITCESREVKPYATRQKLSLEAAARKLRYQFFQQVLASRADRIATAHTLDDQAETVLLKLARGAGTRGLAGIYPKVAVNRQSSIVRDNATDRPMKIRTIVRPLLGTHRSELREYLTATGQTWREDATNQDLRHTRNRIRHEILPKLERELNPCFSEVLAETAEISRAEEEYWSAEISRWLPQVWQNGSRLECRQLGPLPLAFQRRLVRAAAESLGLSLEFSHVEEVLALDREGDCADLPDNWTVARNKNQLHFRQSSSSDANYEYELPVPGRVAIPEAGIELNAEIASVEEMSGNPHLLLDLRFGHGLVVRNWRAGERFWPAHTKGPKKIKELLQDKHITGAQKTEWPVIASGGEVVWVRGFGVRRDFKAAGGSGILIRDSPQRGE